MCQELCALFLNDQAFQEINAVSMPGVNALFPVAALQVTVETPHGCGSFTSIGPNLSLISPETATSLWINKYHHKE